MRHPLVILLKHWDLNGLPSLLAGHLNSGFATESSPQPNSVKPFDWIYGSESVSEGICRAH